MLECKYILYINEQQPQNNHVKHYKFEKYDKRCSIGRVWQIHFPEPRNHVNMIKVLVHEAMWGKGVYSKQICFVLSNCDGVSLWL